MSVFCPPVLSVVAALCVLLRATPAIGAPPPQGEPRAVVLVTVDGARADLLDHPGRVPSICRLAREGWSFPRATTPIPVTFPATVSIMTGLYPDRSGVKDDFASPLGTAPAALAETFQKAGWKTSAFPSDFQSHARSGIDRGFGRFALASPTFTEDARADSAIVSLQGAPDDRAFVWVGFTLLPPSEPWERFGGGAADSTEYLDRAAVTDAAIGRLLTGIERASQDREILVVLVGTHGESVPGWRPAEAPKGENPPSGHGLDLSETVLRVPLVFSWKGSAGSPSRARDSQSEWVSTIDVFPTIVSLAGIPVPDGLDGISLAPVFEGNPLPARPIFHELRLERTLGWGARVGVREGSYKLLSYDGSPALLRIAPARGRAEEGVDRIEPPLREALTRRFQVTVRPLPPGKRQDPQFGLEDEQMRFLDEVRRGSLASEAAERLLTLTGQFPNNGPLLLERAMLDVYRRYERNAATLLDSLRKARPEYIEAEAAYDELLLRFDRTGVAEPRLASLSGYPMFEVDRLWRLGAVQVRAKEYDDAARTYRLAETIGYPSDERLIRFRDQRFMIRQLEAEAVSYPDKTSSMIGLARIFGDLQLYDECYVWIHRARGKAPLDPEPEYWLGHYLMDEGRAKHASAAFNRALEKDSTRVDARIGLAYAQLAQGESDSALTNLQRVATSGGTDALADYNLACLLARKGQVDESLRFLSEAIRKGYANRRVLESDPDLDPLRKDPRFARIIAGLR